MKRFGTFPIAVPARRLAHGTLLSAIMIGGSVVVPSAQAATDIALSGRYNATSLGNWAKTNDAYHDEATVRSVWTINSSCLDAQECRGTVTSDQGWSAPLASHDGQQWIVKHDVPNWETCPDGSPNTGQQVFTFVPVDNNGNFQAGSSTLAGRDKTVGPSGACRVNKWLAIEMPFRLDKIS
ncbi:hypothetical protein [Mycobacterium sp. AB215]